MNRQGKQLARGEDNSSGDINLYARYVAIYADKSSEVH